MAWPRSRLRVRCALAFAAAVLTPLLAVPLQAADERLPVPDEKAQAAARALAREVYEKEYQGATTAESRVALAKKLLEAAANSGDDAAGHFVLLSIARDLAVQAGDAETAVKALEAMGEAFQVDLLPMAADALAKAAPAVRWSTQHRSMAAAAGRLAEQAIAADRLEVAASLAELALDSARKARDGALVKEATARKKDLEQAQAAFARFRQAQAVLEKQPADPQANRTAGEYYCFQKGDWDRGLAMLALGKDEKIGALAKKELEGAATPEAQIALADAWWDAAQQRQEAMRTAMLLRAGTWYREVRDGGATGLIKAKIDKRMEEIAAINRPLPEAPAASAAPGSEPPRAVAPFDEKMAKRHQLLWSKHLKTPIEVTNSIGMKLVLIPPGEFQMGSTQEEVARLAQEINTQKPARWETWETNVLRAESPQHRVKVTKPFYLGMTEVTQAEYQKIMGANPSHFQSPGAPVERALWEEAMDFCRKLSDLPKEKASGAVYRLPTEAEWEYACRAGTTTRFNFGDGEELLGQYAWWSGNSRGQPQPVGRLKANAWGLYDMHGNVSEWCGDWYSSIFYSQAPQNDPMPEKGTNQTDRVVRGGSWSADLPIRFRSAWRYVGNVNQRYWNGGFRVVRAIAAPPQPSSAQ